MNKFIPHAVSIGFFNINDWYVRCFLGAYLWHIEISHSERFPHLAGVQY